MAIQVELIYSLIIMVCLGIFFVYAGKKVALADPTVKPKGIVLVVETGVKAIDDYMKTIMPKKFAKNYYPYFAMVFCYILISNLSSLIGFEAPTSNYSITFAMTFITFVLIQYNALKKKGFFKYVWDTVWPPTNILSVLSPLISISMRLFGNILSGSILMTLIYQFTAWISFHVINFNFLGPIIAPVFHCYFDIFAGCIQTLVFVTLSSILIMMENEDDE
ncbi:F0F1 ATP synthase subunit A [Thomasclavelia cocleata]|uniref:ATP synthase subunit a n=1 Tax=Thomasclavelia cocleata TaxID=69824 RepID=A0A1I0F746_9FIRM|nr:F0F1 ATP synthase subunit A [Thomasclavelia cocleata]MCI9629445.1 F0F1 ATP synthase subunit A [Thomasclavelia cocleata]MCR1960595.1 F0F1 ATP synthase subunit A [Thomasclavelia cocleata]NDO41286.1 F0F1 ATP synthase subunit A [Thomasclavelia cocleata]PJN80325.1 F0F1 ATP synthase subunit A [Thomasclavelia cocleata]SET53793.1 F-type H+-transporting ATPase subunit a [Thomasclavelia cocleata]